MAELEYLSVFLLYTDGYMHYGDISDWGILKPLHRDRFLLGAVIRLKFHLGRM